MNILIVYASLEGQTAKIAGRIAEQLRNECHHVITQKADKLSDDFRINAYDAAIIGGPVHMNHYPKQLKKFVKQYRNWLNNHTSALFTVCMAINSQRPESRQEAENYQNNFTQETQWQPSQSAIFAGAVKYTQYGFLTRLIMKFISKREGGNTDTSQDHEYTDWNEVMKFTKLFTNNKKEMFSETKAF